MEYRFKHIFNFIKIIHESVNYGVEFWNFDPEYFVSHATRFNKDTLLHQYIVCQLMNYYSRLYRKDGDVYDGDDITYWMDLFDEYNIDCVSEINDNTDFNIYLWFKNNQICFEELFDSLAQEMFYFLFMDKLFLVEFNKLVQKVIIEKENYSLYNLHFDKNKIDENGRIKRCSIPQWVKVAVFHRDKGRCVYCGKDLTNLATKLNTANYDHIIPLAEGGANDPCNIQLSCESCNKKKGKSILIPKYEYEPWF